MRRRDNGEFTWALVIVCVVAMSVAMALYGTWEKAQ